MSPPVQSPPAASKRRASARLSASHTVKRAKSDADLAGTGVKSTARKSKYFEADSSDKSEGEESEGSVYEGESDQEESDPEPEPDPEVSDSEKEKTEPKKTPRSKKRKDDHDADADALRGKELWREGVTTGLGPGKEVFIAKPKARDAGDVPYRDETLHPNTRLFLLDLAANNERPWLKG
jgi:hypothetical protein